MLYLVFAVVALVAAWALANAVLLALGIAYLPLAAWALRHYPIDRDW
jgi:hypothetical protein